MLIERLFWFLFLNELVMQMSFYTNREMSSLFDSKTKRPLQLQYIFFFTRLICEKKRGKHSQKDFSSRVYARIFFARRSKPIERRDSHSLLDRQAKIPIIIDPFSHWSNRKPFFFAESKKYLSLYPNAPILFLRTREEKQNMAANTAPIKYAQRSDSIYLTIALPGKDFLKMSTPSSSKKVIEKSFLIL